MQINYRSLDETPLQMAVNFLAFANQCMKEWPDTTDQAIQFATAAAAVAQAEQAARIADALESVIVELSDSRKASR